MKFTSALSILLGASSAFAAPSALPDGVQLVPRIPRAAQRRALRQTSPLIPATSAFKEDSAAAGNSSHVDYSQNWAGAVLIGSGFTSVTGTIVVPTPSAPSGGRRSTQYAASAWVGIDGDTCQTAILQTGVDFYATGSGSVSFDAWYEWFPDYAYTFSGFAVHAGDTIRMTATVSGSTSGSVRLENLSTGRSVSHSFSNQQGSLCQTNAEWIVEDFSSGGGLVPFADFGTVTFTSASATTRSGTVGVQGADIIDIRQGNSVLTDCSTSGSSTVTCTYV
ncbi:hypothetical protein VTK73DRAFT_8251 [Phialemonium thermophilum]|uniref:Acid proteinase n=1 Tax=Phialemonium thermophilum TaxID=223376 RepID=A0ABR3XPV5_9PEZI